MYCYCCGTLKTTQKCPVCGAEERRRYTPQSAEGKALRDLFDMKEIGPQSTIENPTQFQLLTTDILPGEQYTYFRMQLSSIVSVYNVRRMLMDQIQSHTLPDAALFPALCQNAQETGFAQETCQRVIGTIYEMIGWQIPAAPAEPAKPAKPKKPPATEQTAAPAKPAAPKPAAPAKPATPKPAAPPKAKHNPVDGEDITIRMEVSDREAETGFVKKWPVHRKELCSRCRGSGRAGSGTCRQCNGLGVAEADTMLNLTFPAHPRVSNFLQTFPGYGNQGAYGGKSGNLYVVVAVKPLREIVRQQSSMQPASQPQPAPQSRPAPAPRPQPAKPAPAPRSAAPKTPPALQGFQRTGTDGSDLTHVIRISPQENQQGCRKTFRYTRQIRCSGCLGKTPDGCTVCHGKGTMPHEEEITVSISAHPGQTSYTLPVMRGQGNAGTGNGSSGNLLVRVEVDSRQQPPPPKPASQPAAPPSKPADTFSKDGDDLTVYVKVSRHENAKGCTKTVKYARKTCCRVCGGKGTSAGGRCRVCNGSGTITKTEELSVYIAPHPGQDRYTLPIIRGKGNAGLGSGRDGNLFIHVEVQSGWW